MPNYLAIAGGDTFGVTDDSKPSHHVIPGRSVFGQALAANLTAKVYEESMLTNCAVTGNADKGYAVKHNPWAYSSTSAPRAGRSTFRLLRSLPTPGEQATERRSSGARICATTLTMKSWRL